MALISHTLFLSVSSSCELQEVAGSGANLPTLRSSLGFCVHLARRRYQDVLDLELQAAVSYYGSAMN